MEKIDSLFIELTDKCQASCPMCHRNRLGGKVAEHVTNTEITLEQYKTWFPIDFLKQIVDIAFGDIGEPTLCKDFMDIIEYTKQSTNTGLRIYTNGATNIDWAKLSNILHDNDQVTFAIDGLSDTHEIYRRNIDFDTVVNNIKTFGSNKCKIDVLLFKHNEHQIDVIKELFTGYHVNVKHTTRFHGMDKLPVHDENGYFEYYIYPPKSQPKHTDFTGLLNKIENNLNDVTIVPKCHTRLYINSQGYLYPCSWLGTLEPNYVTNWVRSDEETILRQKFHESAEYIKSKLGLTKLETDIVTTLNNTNWNIELPKCWVGKCQLLCAKNCGLNFDTTVSDSVKNVIK